MTTALSFARFQQPPSSQLLLLWRWGWLALYLLLYYVLSGLIPEKYLRDAGAIAGMIEAGPDGDGSYAGTTRFYQLIPSFLIPQLPVLVGGWSLWLIASAVRSWRALALMPLVLLPFIVLNFMAPNKETIVALMALIIYGMAVRVTTRPWATVLAIIALYGVYGAMVRQYYLLILVVFLAFWALRVTPRRFWILYALGALFGLLLLPSEIYETLQGPRDENVTWLAFHGSNTVRTFFFNPLPPTDLGAFLWNYVYALAVLNFPFLIGQTMNEVILFFNVCVWGGLIMRGVRRLPSPTCALALLFLAHLAVLALFEPDLGSYFRHASSVLLYLAPALALGRGRWVHA